MSRPALALFVLSLGSSAYFYQAGGWNSNTRFDLARALVERRQLSIDPYASNTGDTALREGRLFCDKAPGISLLAVPPYAVAILVDGGPRERNRFQAAASYAMTVWAVSLPSAFAAAGLMTLLGSLGVRPWWRGITGLGYTLGTLAWPYSTLLYGHQTAAAFAFLAFAAFVDMRLRASAPTRLRLFAAGLLAGGAVLVEYPATMTVGVIGAYAWCTARSRSSLLWAALGFALPVAVLLAYHWAAFGGPLTLPYSFSTQQPRLRGVFMGIGAPSLRALDYLTFDPYRGLFHSAPWLLLALAGLLRLYRVPARRAEAAVLTVIPLLHVALASSLADWHGGWAFGPRHLVLALPYLALAVGGLGLDAPITGSADSPARRLAALISLAATAAVAFSIFMIGVGTSVRPEVPRAVERPFEEYLFPLFFDGQLSVNTQPIGRPGGTGHTQPRAWNLGQLLGFTGLESLLPLMAFLALAGAWLVSALREGPRLPLSSRGS